MKCAKFLVFFFIFLFIHSNLWSKTQVEEYKLVVEKEYPHDETAYTQGLFFYEDVLYESCGQYGSSNFRKVDLTTGRVLDITHFDDKYFLEGSCVLGAYLYILTWYENVCFVYDIESMTKLAELPFIGEGWGITTDGKHLITSNGSAEISYMDPQSLMEARSITVKRNSKEIRGINELEYINGEIWANVYTENDILIIDPQTGEVRATIDCSNLIPKIQSRRADVLNGIAYNENTGKIYVTGKNWSKLFEISIEKK